MQKLLHHSKYNPYQVFLHQPENGLFLHLCFYIAIRNITFDKWHAEIEPWSHSLLWTLPTKLWNYVPFPVEQPQSEYINFMSAIKHERAKNINLYTSSKKKGKSAHEVAAWLKAKRVQTYCSSAEKMILLMALMYREPSGSVNFSLVRGGMTPLVKYLNAGLGDWMASWNTWEAKPNTQRQ